MKRISAVFLLAVLLFRPGSNVYAATTSYANAGGTGDRQSIITPTTNLSFTCGITINWLINGLTNDNCYFNNQAATGKYIKFEFQTSKIIDEFTYKQDTGTSQGTWSFQGSENNSDWTDLTTGITLGDAASDVVAFSNTTSYKYYQLIGTAGNTSNGPFVLEIEFKITDPDPTPTPTNSLTYTPTATYTPTETFTPTQTYTPTNTRTPAPTFTSWSPNTSTPTQTATPHPPTHTPGPTFTPGGPTATPTHTPFVSLIWARGLADLLPEEQTAIETLLLAGPPAEATSRIWAVTDYRSVNETTAVVSLVNLSGISSPYNSWSAETNGLWIGAVIVDITNDPFAYYYQAPQLGSVGGSMPTIRWPYGGGGATYTQGIHNAHGMLAIDLRPEGGPQAYAVSNGTVSWTCTGTYDESIKLDTAMGTYLYMHLVPGSVSQGSSFSEGDIIGNLVTSPFNDTGNPTCASYSTGTHIHFGFAYTGFLQFEECVLNEDNGAFDCNGQMVFVGGQLPASGGTVIIGTPGTPGTPGDGYIPSQGGEHIWDGLIAAISKFVATQLAKLPDHQNVGIAEFLGNGVEEIGGMVLFFNSLGLLYIIPALVIGGLMLLLEAVRLVMAAYRWVVALEPIK